VVVPRQRRYRYTFDLHLNFFPDEASLRGVVGDASGSRLQELGGDWYYVEDGSTASAPVVASTGRAARE
jgi:hypothetical protein